MFIIDDNKTIHLTRGDMVTIEIGAKKSENEDYSFQVGDVVRLQVFEKNKCNNVVLQKDVIIDKETSFADISLNSDDTRLGEVINKPKDYWYEVELNPDTFPQTIIGYDADGPKIFRLYPEGDGDEYSG